MGARILSADWSQIELRILAHFSKDAILVEAFRHGKDIHRRTACELFGVEPDDVSREQRDVASVGTQQRQHTPA